MIIAIAAKFILTFSTVCRYIIHMGKKDDSAYIEDWAQIDAREELAPKIRETLRATGIKGSCRRSPDSSVFINPA